LELPTTLIDFSTMPDDLGKLMIETINNMLIEMYASLAEAEMKKKEKRQREGIEQMKARGEWGDYGRPAIMSKEEFQKEYKLVRDGELTPTQLMRKLGLKKSTYYSYTNKYLNDKEKRKSEDAK